MESLPALFRDVIAVVRRLGYRYLWIDSLCILQDSEADWEVESAKMMWIYQGATFMIAAEAAGDSSCGLFESTNGARPRSILEIQSHSEKYGMNGHVALQQPDEVPFFPGPLSRRAWTLQEELMAMAILRFANGQMWWQCREAAWSEGYPYGGSTSMAQEQRNILGNFPLSSESSEVIATDDLVTSEAPKPIDRWYEVLTAYNARSITYSTDTLIAISGVARQFQRHLMQKYVAGLWSEDLHRGLCWSTRSPGWVRSSTYNAPSWSWASLDIGVRGRQLCHDFPIFEVKAVADMIDIRTLLDSQDDFGRVKDASLSIRAPCQVTCRCKLPVRFLDSYTKEAQTELDEVGWLAKAYFEGIPRDETCTVSNYSTQEQCNKAAGSTHGRCLLFHVATATRLSNTVAGTLNLILEQVNPQEDKYRRIGLAILEETADTALIWPTKTVTII